MKGVYAATSGYTGGHVPNPTYRAVCEGDTGHAEAVRVEYDPARLSFRKILDVFFTIHDPTTRNRQGADVGSQYRSAIFFHDEEQRQEALETIQRLQAQFSAPIVTEVRRRRYRGGRREWPYLKLSISHRGVILQVVPASTWYPAEEYHQRYYEKNPEAGYCQAVVRHKVDKARAAFPDLMLK
jgi:peptide-methionine (S)-S-oxide reductase